VASVEGRVVLADGTEERLDAGVLRATPEAALRILSVAMPLLAAGFVVARMT
jgi:predicted NAD/FAD-binding protein